MTNQKKQLRLFKVKPEKPIKPTNMRVNFVELKFKISQPIIYENREGEIIETNDVARLSLILIDDKKRSFVINGFKLRLRRKNSSRICLIGPWKRGYKDSFFPYTEIDTSLWEQIETEAITHYYHERSLILNKRYRR
ncbi:hypothetical protein ACFL0A_00810 [Patescibacteria group bacterium]